MLFRSVGDGVGGAAGSWSYDSGARRGGDGAGDWSAEHGEEGLLYDPEVVEKKRGRRMDLWMCWETGTLMVVDWTEEELEVDGRSRINFEAR